ncbi:hypothetical protein HUW46_07384 [Amycolatopsis sp. CA-230715]|nr:hypothetical protein HUW46_07384 [Amycolatopsis sp. CA-230715]
MYKRWPTRPEIVMAAVLRELPSGTDVPDIVDSAVLPLVVR